MWQERRVAPPQQAFMVSKAGADLVAALPDAPDRLARLAGLQQGRARCARRALTLAHALDPKAPETPGLRRHGLSAHGRPC